MGCSVLFTCHKQDYNQCHDAPKKAETAAAELLAVAENTVGLEDNESAAAHNTLEDLNHVQSYTVDTAIAAAVANRYYPIAVVQFQEVSVATAYELSLTFQSAQHLHITVAHGDLLLAEER